MFRELAARCYLRAQYFGNRSGEMLAASGGQHLWGELVFRRETGQISTTALNPP
jgi:hypothetical protein